MNILKTNKYELLAVGLISPLVSLAGCGGPFDASVAGIVTLDGEPLHRGTVAFNPVGGGPGGYAMIDSDGKYTIRTGRELGLPAADYTVTVVASEPPTERRSASGGPPPPGKPITPPWYRTKQTSGLQFTVEKGHNEINIELTSEPPANWRPQRRR